MNVELISKTVGVGSYEPLSPDEIIAAIARHGTIKSDGGKLVQYLMNNKHWSPLQHLSFGFKIETRRSVSAQIFRHRSLNGQEWSLRYAEPLGFEEIELRKEHPTNRQSSTEAFDPKLNFDFYPKESEPFHFSFDDKGSEEIQRYLDYSEGLYNALITAGVAKECARDILPLCTKTTIHLTGTLRDWLGFLNVRLDPHSQKEIRLIAQEILKILKNELPDIFSKIDADNGLFM